GLPLGERRQLALVNQLVHRHPAAVKAAEEIQHLSHGEEVRQGGGLELDARLLVKVAIPGPAAVENLPGTGVGDALDHLDGGGLARAVGAEEAKTASRPYAKADAVHGGDLAVGFAQVAHLQQVVGGHGQASRARSAATRARGWSSITWW